VRFPRLGRGSGILTRNGLFFPGARRGEQRGQGTCFPRAFDGLLLDPSAGASLGTRVWVACYSTVPLNRVAVQTSTGWLFRRFPRGGAMPDDLYELTVTLHGRPLSRVLLGARPHGLRIGQEGVELPDVGTVEIDGTVVTLRRIDAQTGNPTGARYQVGELVGRGRHGHGLLGLGTYHRPHRCDEDHARRRHAGRLSAVYARSAGHRPPRAPVHHPRA
jgi:hypothetical protein